MSKEKEFDENINDLTRKLLSGKIESHELEYLNTWYDSFENNEEINVYTSKTEDFYSVKSQLLNRINSNRNKSPKFFLLVNQYRNVAAAIILFSLILSGIVFYLQSIDKDTQIVWNEIHVEDGHQKVITLNDKSQITLNAGSYFKYPSIFNGEISEVYLEGEAYFEITPNKNRKFIVNTPKLSTTVLGTKFNVNSFSNESENSVSLIEGKVEVTGNSRASRNKSVILKPLEKYVLTTINNRSIVKSFNLNEEIGWKDKVYVFNQKPLNQILKVLSRTYGVKFEISNNEYANKSITANFNNASVSTIVKSIKKLTNLKHNEMRDNNYQKIIFY